TVDQVADAIAQHSTTTKDEAKQVLLTEFGRIIKNWSDAVQEKIASAGNGPKTGDAKNSFTQARGDALAPWTFYRTGFTTSDDVANHAAGLQSVALDRVVDAMEALEKDLARQESEFRLRSDQLDRQGVPNASAAAIREKEEQRRQKQTYDSWENLRESKTHISRVLSRLRERGLAESDFDYTFGRGAGALVGALIGNVVTTMRNLSSIFFGRQLRALGMGHLNSLLQGMAFTGYEALKIMGSLALGLPRAGFFLIRGMGRGVPQLLKGEARAAYHSALRDVIRELAEDVPRRLTTVRDLEASGLYSLPDRVKEFDNQILGSILYRGRIPAAELSGKAKAFGYATAAAEASFLAVANAAFPTVGDAGINAAMYSVLNSSIGPLHSMETRLRKVFNDWKKNNYRKFDFQNPANPANRLLAREAGVNENDLSIMRRTYEMAGLSFDTEAVKFIAELNSGNTKAQFLANDARLSLGDAMINQMNRAAFGNAPLSLKQGGTFVKFFRPLYGFPVRAFADWESTLSVPSTTDSDTARMRLWFQAMSSVMLGLLLTGAGGQLKDEAVARLLKRALFNQESPNKLPWEEDSFPRALANTTRLAMESVPLLGIIGNLIIPANSPARASYEPTIAVYESGAAAARYVANVVSTGDPTHGLPELIAKFVPDAKAVINRLPSQSGRRESANVVAEIKRFAPSDVVREPFARGSGGRIASKMAPHIEDMDNYAMKGDTRKFLAAHRAAVNAARQMGKADPEKTVQNAFRSRNPYTRALQRQMTTSERTQTLRRAGRQPGANLRKDIELAERRYNAAAALIGIGSSNFTQRPRVGSTRSSQPSRSVPRVSTSLRRSPGSFYSQSRQSGSRSLSRFY
ncbi:MAG TPA: hypothetical protein VHO25_21225, partial [Polyangiaceae bacterium]|nr:hypothetical protein [Polyangiaceae bacterium]